MRRKRAANGLLTTTDVVGLLYRRGVPVSRDRLYEMADACSMRRTSGLGGRPATAAQPPLGRLLELYTYRGR